MGVQGYLGKADALLVLIAYLAENFFATTTWIRGCVFNAFIGQSAVAKMLLFDYR